MSVLTASTAVARPAERHRVLGDASRGTKARVTLRWPSGSHCRGGGQSHTELSVRKVHSTWYIQYSIQGLHAGSWGFGQYLQLYCTRTRTWPAERNETMPGYLLLYSVLVLYRMYAGALARHVMKKCRRRSQQLLYEPGPAGVPCRQGDGATERLQFITVQCVGVLRKLHRTVVPCRGPELLVNRQSSIVSSQAWAA
ncbi:hypothetical protein F5882DRAFT_412708 [Hyaloscypha sp. PMI_1271]|nr:hypothetical protein F5882DRAFT_412708 [Hyaloscypha sp. PMI_1271]